MKLGIRKKMLIAILVMITIYEPWYFRQNTIFHYCVMGLKVICIVWMIFKNILIKQLQFSIVYVLILAINIGMLIGSMLYGSGQANAFKNVLNILLTCLWLMSVIGAEESARRDYIDGMSWYMMLICVMNCISILFPLSGISEEYRLRNYYFLGSDNSATPIYLSALMTAYIRQSYFKGFRLNHVWILICAFAFFAIYQQIGTAVVSAAFIIIFGIISKKRKGLFHLKLLPLVLSTLMIWVSILFTSLSFLKDYINLFIYEKYNSIPSRVLLWQTYLAKVQNRPLFGFGAAEIEDLTAKAGTISRWMEEHNTHNSFIEVIYNSGYVSFCLYIVLLLAVAFHFDKTCKESRSAFMAVLIFTYLIRGIAECNNTGLYFMIPFVYFVNVFENQGKEGNQNETST